MHLLCVFIRKCFFLKTLIMEQSAWEVLDLSVRALVTTVTRTLQNGRVLYWLSNGLDQQCVESTAVLTLKFCFPLLFCLILCSFLLDGFKIQTCWEDLLCSLYVGYLGNMWVESTIFLLILFYKYKRNNTWDVTVNDVLQMLNSSSQYLGPFWGSSTKQKAEWFLMQLLEID